MAEQWYYSSGDERFGPVSADELQRAVSDGVLAPSDFVWKEGMADWQPASSEPTIDWSQAVIKPQKASTAPPFDLGHVATKRIAAAVCAILLGCFGVHKFIIGKTKAGVVTLLLLVVTCGVASVATTIIGIIEGIVYLTKTDEEFYETYLIGDKSWF